MVQDAYTRSLALWRGTAAEDVPTGPALREVVARLTDQYLSAVEEHTEIQLAQGRPMATIKRLRELIRQHPLRERLYGQLMVALYRCGDVVGALDVFGVARRVLAEELGLDPGPELRCLHQAVLRRDADLMSLVGPRAGEEAVSMRAGKDGENGEDTAAVRAGKDGAAVRVDEDTAVVRAGDERPPPPPASPGARGVRGPVGRARPDAHRAVRRLGDPHRAACAGAARPGRGRQVGAGAAGGVRGDRPLRRRPALRRPAGIEPGSAAPASRRGARPFS